MHKVQNADTLSPEVLWAIVETVQATINGNTTWKEEVAREDKPMDKEQKGLQDF